MGNKCLLDRVIDTARRGGEGGGSWSAASTDRRRGGNSFGDYEKKAIAA